MGPGHDDARLGQRAPEVGNRALSRILHHVPTARLFIAELRPDVRDRSVGSDELHREHAGHILKDVLREAVELLRPIGLVPVNLEEGREPVQQRHPTAQ
ncbi:MAG: hypothetical protein IPP98_08060 [Gemmatimonadetes bacterium]|nr:hypothetical protein [Gemmatimonadota bacterium]